MRTNQRLVEQIVNRQFEMVGAPLKMEDVKLSASPPVITKKNTNWWDVYKFENEAQYKEWREWAEGELEKAGVDVRKEMDEIDMKWGMVYKN